MAFRSDTFRRPDGRWVFIAIELLDDDKQSTYELVHPDKFTPFTADQIFAMKLDAMEKFSGVPGKRT